MRESFDRVCAVSDSNDQTHSANLEFEEPTIEPPPCTNANAEDPHPRTTPVAAAAKNFMVDGGQREIMKVQLSSIARGARCRSPYSLLCPAVPLGVLQTPNKTNDYKLIKLESWRPLLSHLVCLGDSTQELITR